MIVFNSHEHGHRIAREVGTGFNPATDTVISRTRGGILLGGVLYQNYTGVGGSITLHVSGFCKHWGDRDMLWVAFDYPFSQLQCKKLFGNVPETNETALAFDKKLGFKEVARIAGVFPDGAMIVLCMEREDCRWLRLQPRKIVRGSFNGQELGPSAA